MTNEELQIRISAEIAELKKGIADATAEFKKLNTNATKEVQGIQKEIQWFKSKGSVEVKDFEKAFTKSMGSLSEEGAKEFKEINDKFQSEISTMAQKGKISIEDLEKAFDKSCEGLTKDAKDAFKQIYTEANTQMKKTADEVDNSFASIGTSITNAMKVGVAAVAGIATGLIALGPATEEYRQNQAKLASSFESVGSSAEQAQKVYNDFYRILGDTGTATEAASLLGQLTTEEKALAEWTEICKGAYATFPDSLPIEGLIEASNETAKVGELTGSLADAINWAKITNEEFASTLSGNENAMKAFNDAMAEGATREDAFNAALAACNTEAEREALIRESLTGIYGDAAKAYETNAASILAANEAQAKLDAAMSATGEAMAPVMTMLKELGADVLTAIQPYIQSFAENYLPVIRDVLGEVGTKLSEALTWLKEHQTLLAVIAGVITGLVASIGLYNTVAAVKAAMDAAQVATLGGLAAAYLAQAAAMAVAIAPYALIVAAIAAVIAIIVVCVKHWDEIKEAVGKAWDKIKEATKKAVEAVVKWFEDMKAKIGEKVDNIKQAVSEKFEAVKTAINDKVQAAKDAVVNKFNEIKNNISEKTQAAKDAVVNKFDEIKTGMSDRINGAKDAVANALTALKTNFTEKLSAAKDSVFTILGNIKDKFTSIMDGCKNAVSTAIDKIKSIMNFNWSLPKLKLPKISISGKFSINPPSVPRFSISWNKLGGVFDKPTLFGYGNSLQGIGEDGAEAVVPLEKNTQWLDRMASMLAAKLHHDTPIVLEVDGNVFAQTSIDTINKLTRQQGKLALNII